MSQTKHSHSHLNAVPPRVGVRGRSFIRKNYGGALENVPVDAFNSIPLTKRKPVMKRHRRAIFTAPPSETVPTKKVSLWQKIKTMIRKSFTEIVLIYSI